MKEWNRLFARGKRELAKHRTKEALTEFHRALELCPADQRSDITQILFYLGASLHKLGYSGFAVRSWSMAAGLEKSGNCSRMVERMTNSYGMVRGREDEDENFRAFRSIQLSRYLASRGTRKFGSLPERDMVNDVIRAAWDTLSESVNIQELTIPMRLGLFRHHVVVFPYLECPENWECNVTSFDFRAKRKISDENECSCGSGRSYITCCGRIPSEDELSFGHF